MAVLFQSEELPVYHRIDNCRFQTLSLNSYFVAQILNLFRQELEEHGSRQHEQTSDARNGVGSKRGQMKNHFDELDSAGKISLYLISSSHISAIEFAKEFTKLDNSSFSSSFF